MTDPVFLSEAEVYRRLDPDGCIEAVRVAMAALSQDPAPQPLRSISDLGEGRMFGMMPGRLSGSPDFGAKLVSVFPDAERPGRSAHRGSAVLFDGETGRVACVADAGAVTHVRTAAASAVATAALATPEAECLAIFGCGAQARSHLQFLPRTRKFRRIGIWGRDVGEAERLAEEASIALEVEAAAWTDARSLAEAADVICTVTSAAEPILFGKWVRPGTHVNVVGSSYAGPREVDSDLVARARFFVDYRSSALVAAAEFLRAKDEGRIGDDHIVGEIGEVLSGRIAGRRSADEVTLYKSLGHIVQDLAAVRLALTPRPRSAE